jgi:Reverse transcriptase (RNA-dependent DNA polymerase)
MSYKAIFAIVAAYN